MAFKRNANVRRNAAPVTKKNDRTEIFKANLPCFKATINGTVVADSEPFESKAGKEFTKFRVAYNRKRDDDSATMFIAVFLPADGKTTVSKGDYVEVKGDYFDELGEFRGDPAIYRTLFAESVRVILASDK